VNRSGLPSGRPSGSDQKRTVRSLPAVLGADARRPDVQLVAAQAPEHLSRVGVDEGEEALSTAHHE
jgi:hypothetical protein